MMNYGRSFFLNDRCLAGGFLFNGWNWLIGIGILLVVVAVIVLVTAKRSKTLKDDSVLEALRLKYAEGEISTEEYKKRKSILEGK